MNFLGDIPLSLAVSAHSGTSFSPERRGASEVAGFSAELQRIYETLRENAVKGGTVSELDEQFASMRSRLAQLYRKYLASSSRVMSTMIAGPSNFPVRRNSKRRAVADRRYDDYADFKARAIRAALRVLRPDLRPIMAGDADALERLEAEIRKAEAVQERMKNANAAIRKFRKKGREAQLVALVEQGFSDAMAAKLLEPSCFQTVGFEGFELSNNSANIRRMKQRLEQIARAKAMPDSSMEGANGVTLEDSPSDNRVRLAFPGKPSFEIRSRLKKNGFRWAPSLGVWQAYRNYRSMELAKEIVGPAAEPEVLPVEPMKEAA